MILNFKKLFGGGKTVLGIDIGSSSIKVVELKKEGGRAVLKAYGEIALGPYAGSGVGSIPPLTNDKLSQALQDVIQEAGITTKESGVAIPFKSSLVSLIEMPALPEKKLEEMIPIEARKYIPVPISEVTLDWWIVPKERYDTARDAQRIEDSKNNKTDVLVISIHNEILSNYNNIVRNNNLETSFFEIEMFSASRALISRSDTPILVFDSGALGTKLYISERGVIRTSHIINRGSQDITQAISKALGVDFNEAEKIKKNITSLKESDQKIINDIVSKSLEYIWSETKTIIGNFEKKYGKNIGSVILTGGGASLDGFRERAEKQLNVKVEIGDPFAKIATPAFISSSLRNTGLEFSVAAGTALRKLEELS